MMHTDCIKLHVAHKLILSRWVTNLGQRVEIWKSTVPVISCKVLFSTADLWWITFRKVEICNIRWGRRADQSLITSNEKLSVNYSVNVCGIQERLYADLVFTCSDCLYSRHCLRDAASRFLLRAAENGWQAAENRWLQPAQENMTIDLRGSCRLYSVHCMVDSARGIQLSAITITVISGWIFSRKTGRPLLKARFRRTTVVGHPLGLWSSSTYVVDR